MMGQAVNTKFTTVAALQNLQHENFVRNVFAIVNFSINLRSEVTAETVSDIFVFELF